MLPEDPNQDSFDIHMDMPDSESAHQEVEDRIVASYEITKNDTAGKTPAGILRAVEEIRKSRVPWNRIFARFLGQSLAKDDYSYSQPNRRFIGQDLYLPSLMNYKVGKIGVFPDMSGSIGMPEASAFAGELRKMAGIISEVVVGCWDTQVHTWETIRDMTNLQKALTFKGGGGTDVNCVFNEIKRRNEQFEVVIILTDGYYGSLPSKYTIKYPVIFVMTSDVKPEWGQHVQMKL